MTSHLLPSLPLWTTSDLRKAIGAITDVSKIPGVECYDVTIDSRCVTFKSLFIGIDGEKYNGSSFAKQAISLGAAACIVDHVPDNCSSDDISKLIIVQNTYDAMCALSRYARERFSGKVVAVTGSVGKTTTKDMIAYALSKAGYTVHATMGNQNNKYGLPLSVCRMPYNCDVAVLEIGIDHKEMMKPLSAIARPHISLITSIALAHTEFFGTIDDIAEGKADIMQYAIAGGVNILNGYCSAKAPSFFAKIAQHHGLNFILIADDAVDSNANISLVDINGTNVTTRYSVNCIDSYIHVYHKNNCDSATIGYSVGSEEKHVAINSLSVLAVTLALNIDPSTVMSRLYDFQASTSRFCVHIMQNGAVIIDDTYNASPLSMRSAIEAVAARRNKSTTPRNAIVILGDMLELGNVASLLHEAVASDLIKMQINKVYVVGPLMRKMFDLLPDDMRGGAFETSKAAAECVGHDITCDSDNIILIKGSRGMAMEIVVKKIFEYFATRQH